MKKLLLCGVMLSAALCSCSAGESEPTPDTYTEAPRACVQIDSSNRDGLNPYIKAKLDAFTAESMEIRWIEKPEEIEEKPAYTAEELELLALVIFQEAGGDNCSDETRLMVGCVVLNRVEDSRFPDTIYEVVTQKGQYGSLYWTGAVWPARASWEGEQEAVGRSYAIAERVLDGERILPADAVWQAEFPQGTEIIAYSDGMYFCR